MGYKMRRYECPECTRQFDHLHSVTDGVEDGPPEYCPKCGAFVGVGQEPIPYIGGLLKPQNQSLDRTYRAMEKASYDRAEEAASMLNVPVSEVSDIRMTNMKDNIREGESSAMTPPTPKSMPMTPASPMTAQTVGAATAAMTRTGPLAGAGSNFLDTRIRRNHAATAAAVQRNGQQGSYSGN